MGWPLAQTATRAVMSLEVRITILIQYFLGLGARAIADCAAASKYRWTTVVLQVLVCPKMVETS